MNANWRLAIPFALVSASALMACSANDSGGARSSDSAAVAQGSVPEARATDSAHGAGMNGDQMAGMMSMGMMDSMRTHMHMMEGMSPDSMKTMLPAHRQMVANMLSQFSGDMRKMNMQPDATWTALTDSVRRDLVQLPEMTASHLRSFMPEHGARVMRLMQMHRSMMGGMKM